MTQTAKIALNTARDIPFNKLVLSQNNVRRIKDGVSIEHLADDIARRGLIQSLNVRPVVDADGTETGMFEVPAGGRRYRAVERLVKAKRLTKTAPVPCVVRAANAPTTAEEDSLAENVQRAPLHPLDQFRAFLTLREQGQSEEEIAAVFFVSVAVVKQRLRLASVSPKLLDIYAEDGMTLDQLMAFTISGDHARQEQVFERLAQSYDKQPYTIRRMLTEGAVRASDKRAQFIGVEAYVEAGGAVMNDLFQGDDGGWLQDVGLVDMMVAEKLREEAAAIQAEGWKWIEVAPDFGYGHTYGLRQLRGEITPLSDEEEQTRDALQAEMAAIEETYSGTDSDLPEGIDQRLSEIEAALEALDHRPITFDADEVARAGALVSIAADGQLRVERGYVRPEDELRVEPEPVAEPEGDHADDGTAAYAVAARTEGDDATIHAGPDAVLEPEEDEGIKPIPDRLLSELTAHRTVALREALGSDPHIAFLAALHALVLKLFYRYALDSCLDLDIKSVGFAHQAPGLADTSAAKSLDLRQREWEARLPKEPTDLWDALAAFDADSRSMLFAHCVGASVNATFDAYNRRPRALANADRLAQAVDLDMVQAGWTPTVDNFFGRVTKARIVAAVREAKGARAGDRIEHLKKGEMAERAEELLAGSGWLPEPLRTQGRAVDVAVDEAAELEAEIAEGATVEETAADGGESAMGDNEALAEDEEVAFETLAIAAE